MKGIYPKGGPRPGRTLGSQSSITILRLPDTRPVYCVFSEDPLCVAIATGTVGTRSLVDCLQGDSKPFVTSCQLLTHCVHAPVLLASFGLLIANRSSYIWRFQHSLLVTRSVLGSKVHLIKGFQFHCELRSRVPVGDTPFTSAENPVFVPCSGATTGDLTYNFTLGRDGSTSQKLCAQC